MEVEAPLRDAPAVRTAEPVWLIPSSTPVLASPASEPETVVAPSTTRPPYGRAVEPAVVEEVSSSPPEPKSTETAPVRSGRLSSSLTAELAGRDEAMAPPPAASAASIAARSEPAGSAGAGVRAASTSCVVVTV